jgi:maltokinase
MAEQFPVELTEQLPGYLAAQRWYAGSDAVANSEVHVTKLRRLWTDGADHDLWHLVVDSGRDHYQLVLGVRPAGEPAGFLHGHEHAVLGAAAGVFAYDAACDGDLSKVLLEVVSEGRETASFARPMGVEQSNTSIVYDDRLILKVFRRLRPGRNPEIEVTTALSEAGFAHVAAPVLEWREEPYDLAFGQQFLAGATEGWAMALTSLRDLYSSTEGEMPEEVGGDFGAEAERLGRVTADMHVALHRVFGPAPPARAAAGWSRLIESLGPRLAQAGKHVDRDLLSAARPLLDRLGAITDPGPAIRVHGDYHLGQVMRTDMGWYVLDFEGEPTKPVEERTAPASVLKDVTGMLRSLHYASRLALAERAVVDWADMVPSARAWEAHNRQAFLEGYRHHPEVAQLLPEAPASAAVMLAYELDKCLYELDYELSHRPEWVPIPLDGLERLVEGGGGD